MRAGNNKLVSLVLISVFMALGCTKKEKAKETDTTTNPSNNPNAVTKTFTSDNAIISSSAAYSSGGVIRLAIAANGAVAGCDNSNHTDNPSPLTNPDSTTNGDVLRELVHYTPPFNQTVSGVKLYLKTPGDASSNSLSGTVWVIVALASGIADTGSILAAGTFDASTLGHSNVNTEYTINFSSPVNLTGGTTYSFSISGLTGYTPASGYGIYWGMNSNCSSTTIGNLTWGKQTLGYSVGSYKPEFTIIGTRYNTSAPTAEFVGDAGAAATWDPASFTAIENPNGGAEAGTITLLYWIFRFFDSCLPTNRFNKGTGSTAIHNEWTILFY